MDVDTAKKLLVDNGYVVSSEKVVQGGVQIRLTSGSILTVFNTGKVIVQGKPDENVKEILSNAKTPSESPASNKIFVVYGHDEKASLGLQTLLMKWGLEPLLLNQLPPDGDTIIEKLENNIGQVEYAIVLATPDDEGHRAGRPNEKSFRVRQNVVLELGMVLAQLKRKRVAILIKEPDKMEKPSDINGLLYIAFKDRVEDARADLFNALNAAGYNIEAHRL